MKNDAALSKGKATGSMTAENTNMHKLMKMGMDPKTKITGSKKTPA
jgi:Fe2+ transport system protein FeoA